jgi:hypothetical protein
MHGALAERAGFFALLDHDQHARENGQVTLIPILQGPDLLLQERKRREGECAVFFSP